MRVLRSFKSGSLGSQAYCIIPQILLESCWLETAQYIWPCHLQLPVLPCGFSTSLRDWKTLRAELTDSLIFVRLFVPSKMVLWGSQVGLLVCKLTNKEKKKRHHSVSLFLFLISNFLSSQAVSSQVLSAFTSLTTVFGMGTGGSSQPSSLNLSGYSLKTTQKDNLQLISFSIYIPVIS